MIFSIKPSHLCESLLCLVDSTLSITVFSPAVVCYWRGCWQLMDTFLFPKNAVHSLWASTSIGLGLGVFFGLFQSCFGNAFPQKKCKILYYVVSRIYTAVYCVTCVNHWRGIWMAWDTYHNISWQSGAMSAGCGLFALTLTRGVRNTLAPPFLIISDHREGYFTVPTLFRKKKSCCGSFCLDVIFSVVITGSLVVFVWRGFWVFLDNTLFPDNETYSAWGSLVIGLTVTVLTFMAQMIMAPCLRNIKNCFQKLILEDVYLTTCFVGAVNMWRGVWNLLNIYLYPDRPVLSNAITAVGGNLLLMCLFCGNTILVRGAQMDGIKEGAAGVIFETKYLRKFYKTWKQHLQDADRGKSISVTKVENQLCSNLVVKTEKVGENNEETLEGRGRGDGHSYSEAYKENENMIIQPAPIGIDYTPLGSDEVTSEQNNQDPSDGESKTIM